MSDNDTCKTCSLSDLLDPWTRFQLHSSSLFAVFFLAVYGRLVCPFIGGVVSTFELAVNLLLVFAVQVVLREFLFYHDVP